MKLHETVVGAEVGGVVKLAGFFGLADGLLVLLRHKADHAMLFAGPEAGRGMAAGDNGRRDSLRLLIYKVGDDEHAAPGLSQNVKLVQVQVLPEGHKLVHPGLLRPQFRMSLQIRVAAAKLVVGDYLSARMGYLIQYLKVIVCTAGAAMQKQQGLMLLGGLPHHPVIRLVPHEGHVSFFDSHTAKLTIIRE